MTRNGWPLFFRSSAPYGSSHYSRSDRLPTLQSQTLYETWVAQLSIPIAITMVTTEDTSINWTTIIGWWWVRHSPSRYKMAHDGTQLKIRTANQNQPMSCSHQPIFHPRWRQPHPSDHWYPLVTWGTPRLRARQDLQRWVGVEQWKAWLFSHWRRLTMLWTMMKMILKMMNDSLNDTQWWLLKANDSWRWCTRIDDR